MLQLLVYGEILPSVCALLNYDVGRIKKAIVLGSLIPLVRRQPAGMTYGALPLESKAKTSRGFDTGL